LRVQELCALPRAVRGDVASVARALLTGGAGRVDDPAWTELPRWIASIERLIPMLGDRPRCGVWLSGGRVGASASSAGEASHAEGGGDAGGASGTGSIARGSDARSLEGGVVERASTTGGAADARAASRLKRRGASGNIGVTQASDLRGV